MNDDETLFHISIKFIFIRAVYFAGAFIGLVCISLDPDNYPLVSRRFYEAPYYWYCISALSLLVALIGPPVFDFYKSLRR